MTRGKFSFEIGKNREEARDAFGLGAVIDDDSCIDPFGQFERCAFETVFDIGARFTATGREAVSENMIRGCHDDDP